MSPAIVTDYVLKIGLAGVYVQIRNNLTGHIFTSTALTDSNGQFSIASSPWVGDYSAYVSLVNGPPWTLYDPHYVVADQAYKAIFYASSFGALGDGLFDRSVSITAGTTALVTTAGKLTTAAIGKPIGIYGAGAAGVPYGGTITAVTDSNHATVSPAVSSTVAAVFAAWGSDDSIAINNTIIAANAAGGGRVVLGGPLGLVHCLKNPILPLSNVWLEGIGWEACLLIPNVGATNGGTGDACRISQATNYYQFVTLSDFSIDGSLQIVSPLASYSNGMTLQGVDFLTCRNIHINYAGGYPIAVGSVGGVQPFIERPVLRGIVIEHTRGNADSIGGGGINRGLLDDYDCREPTAGTFVDLTNLNGFIFRNLRGKNSAVAPAIGCWGLGGDFGWQNVLVDGFDFDGVSRGVVVNQTGAFPSNNIRFKNGNVRNAQKDIISVGGVGSGSKMTRVEIDSVTCTAWNLDNTGNAAFNPQDVSGLEVHHCQFYAPNGAPYDMDLGTGGGALGVDTYDIHDNLLLNGIHETLVQAPAHIHDNPNFNAPHHMATPAFVSPYTPSLLNGDAVAITLTGNIQINNPTPSTMRYLGTTLLFVFTQDGTGGRTVTWQNQFLTTWQAASAPNAVSVIMFVWNGTAWQQAAGQISIDQNGNITGPVAITGALSATGTVKSTQVAGTGAFQADGAVGSTRVFAVTSAGVARWSWGASGNAEGGGNAGSDWALNRYADGGGFLDNPIIIRRNTGGVEIYDPLTAKVALIAQKDIQRSRQTPTEAVLVSGVDATAGELIGVTITAARVVGAPLNAAIGQRLTFTFIQGGAGAFAITWNAIFKKTWADAGNATNARSTISFVYDGTNWNQDGAQAPYV